MTQKSIGSAIDVANQNVDYIFKIFIIGNSSVGKTSFLFRYTENSFTPIFASTLGLDFKVKYLVRHDKRIKLQIWDTAGQERHQSGTSIYYRGTMGFILMYDITNDESFNAIKNWILQIETHTWGKPTVILIGNKCDMKNDRVVLKHEGKELAEQFGLEFFETSAKDDINIKFVFERLTNMILEKVSVAPEPFPPSAASQRIPDHDNKPGAYIRQTIRVTDDDNDKKKKKNKRFNGCECSSKQ